MLTTLVACPYNPMEEKEVKDLDKGYVNTLIKRIGLESSDVTSATETKNFYNKVEQSTTYTIDYKNKRINYTILPSAVPAWLVENWLKPTGEFEVNFKYIASNRRRLVITTYPEFANKIVDIKLYQEQ